MTETTETTPFTVVLIPFGIETLDGRIVGEPTATRWHRPLPLPVLWNGADLAQDEKCAGHHEHTTPGGLLRAVDIRDGFLVGRGDATHPALRIRLDRGPVPIGVDLDVLGDWEPGKPITRWELAAVTAYGSQRSAWPQALMTKVG